MWFCILQFGRFPRSIIFCRFCLRKERYQCLHVNVYYILFIYFVNCCPMHSFLEFYRLLLLVSLRNLALLLLLLQLHYPRQLLVGLHSRLVQKGRKLLLPIDRQ